MAFTSGTGPEVCVCVAIPFILDTEFLHLPSAVVGLIFLAGRIQPFLSLVDLKVEFCVLTKYLSQFV